MWALHEMSDNPCLCEVALDGLGTVGPRATLPQGRPSGDEPKSVGPGSRPVPWPRFDSAHQPTRLTSYGRLSIGGSLRGSFARSVVNPFKVPIACGANREDRDPDPATHPRRRST